MEENGLSHDNLKLIMQYQADRHKAYQEKNRIVPLDSHDPGVCCFGCGIELVTDYGLSGGDGDVEAHKSCYDHASVHMIMPGYGSRYDMVEILIGICDDCIDKAKQKGWINWQFNTIHVPEGFEIDS